MRVTGRRYVDFCAIYPTVAAVFEQNWVSDFPAQTAAPGAFSPAVMRRYVLRGSAMSALVARPAIGLGL